ncbi:hypothetical protein BDZ85DRAFT_264184 [Elsinoe ampelina]|uniref:Uncharacterized protein n=1 Tax=Elsinoe ampelina TaxID=302913 RepID=A0A6A6G7C9_9PEZI|nr:hypothetical protein BDZ85DRAFT_264184 [Elsinoe ampelina]
MKRPRPIDVGNYMIFLIQLQQYSSIRRMLASKVMCTPSRGSYLGVMYNRVMSSLRVQNSCP